MTCAVIAARRARAGLRIFIGAVGAGLLAVAQAAPPADRAAGLIVQLRDAPSHVELMRERADARGVAPAKAAHESARWQRVLAAVPDARWERRQAALASAQRLRFEQPMTRAQADVLAARLATLPEVAWAVLDTRERRLQVAQNPPNDPYFGQQWWAQMVQGSDGLPPPLRLRGVPGFFSAWMLGSTGGPAARVAVLDSGITNHPELAGRLLAGYDMVSDAAYGNDGDGRDADPSDPGDWVDATDIARDPGRFKGCTVEPSKWHGTAIAGIVGATTNNGAGMAGINWNADVVMPVRVAAKCGADVDDIVQGMLWAGGLAACVRTDSTGACTEFSAELPVPRARVVNISYGGTGSCAPYQGAIDALRARGVVVVAAAGNEWNTPTRPAKCPGVIGVVALNRDGFKSNYSNFGAELAASGIATVGGDDFDLSARWNALADSGILSIGNSGDTVPLAPQANDYYSYFGTSFSAPLVAGTVSLMLSVKPSLTHVQIVQGLQRSARPHVRSNLPGVLDCSNDNPGRCLCTVQTCGAGILDTVRALQYAANPADYVPTALTPAVINATDLRSAAEGGPDRPPNPVAPPPDSGGGGGAMSEVWLAGLALAALLLASRRRSA